MVIGKDDVYKFYKDLVIHSETISWNRFANFLVISSILVLAWATIFVVKSPSLCHKAVMSLISGFGIYAGIVWADIGDRGRKYLDQYKDKAKSIETNSNKKDWWEGGIEKTDRPFQIDIDPKRWSSSRTLLFWVPLIFSGLHVILLLATWLK
jgi:hypothetical protein